jgi:MOSC domain-containing protein YiiM
MQEHAISISHIYISPGHNFFGHHGQPAGSNPVLEVQQIECVADRGVRGDRFFDYKESYKGQITFFAWETFRELCNALNIENKAPGNLRRNVITHGVALNSLIDREFEIQGIRFQGVCECSPCYWMDQALAPGAEAFLKGRGGLRARILSSGFLRVDEARAAVAGN